MKTNAVLVVTLLLLGLASELVAQVTRYAPKVGQPHVDFVLPSIDGENNIQLSKYRGKKVLLMHFASW